MRGTQIGNSWKSSVNDTKKKMLEKFWERQLVKRNFEELFRAFFVPAKVINLKGLKITSH